MAVWNQNQRAEKARRIAELLEEAFQALALNGTSSRPPRPPPQNCRRWADLVVDSMTTPGRYYHDVDHVFQVAEPFLALPPLHPHRAVGTLAAVFHDMIYLSIDRELSVDQRQVLLPEVEFCPDSSSLLVSEPEKIPDPLLPSGLSDSLTAIAMVLRVFGLEAVDDVSHSHALMLPCRNEVVQLSKSVTNELLSALLAVKLLYTVLSRKHLFQLVACIEASIPFRRPSSPTPAAPIEQPSLFSTPIMEELHQRWGAVARDLQLGLSDSEVVETAQLAVVFANADVGSFAAAAPAFLENSWRLLPEWNPALAAAAVTTSGGVMATLRDAQAALKDLLDRYSTLRVGAIFQSFRGRPDNLLDLQRKAAHNMECVANYTRVRRFSVAVLMDALSLLLHEEGEGGDDWASILQSCDEAGGELAVLRRFEGSARCRRLLSENGWDLAGGTTDDEGDNDRDGRLLRQCLTTPRRGCCWGDATETLASALLYKTVPWEEIVQCPASAASSADPGWVIRRVPEPARGAILEAVREAIPPRSPIYARLTNPYQRSELGKA